MTLHYFLIFSLAAVLPASAQNVPPLGGTPCLQVANVAEMKPAPDRRSLMVSDKRNRWYRLHFTAVCEALQVRPELGFQTLSGSKYACMARDDSIYSSRDVGANRLCRIQSIEFYNEEPPVPPLRGRG